MSTPRAEKVFRDVTAHLFAAYADRLTQLQTEIGDGLTLEPFAKKVVAGISTPFGQDKYPVLVVEPVELGLDIDHGAKTGGVLPVSVVVIVKGKPEKGDELTYKTMRYGDALASLIDEDYTMGGAIMRANLSGRIRYAIGKEGEQFFGVLLAQIELEY